LTLDASLAAAVGIGELGRMSGWLRHIALRAQARTGVSGSVAIWTLLAVVAAVLALVFLLIAAFVFLADRYDSLTAGLVLAAGFAALAVIALIACLITRRRNQERARLELAARSSAGAGWLDPKLLAVAVQVGQAIGWRRLASLAAVGVLAAGLAGEWFRRAEADEEEPKSDSEQP
jgi:hypothetical protein